MREYHVRFCERLGVRFPRSTHQYFCGETHFFSMSRRFIRRV
jgi:hypothetical protein